MDRCGIFVDVGHLVSEGGRLCCGMPERRRLTCRYLELINQLTELVLRHAQLPLLRVYWYDAAKNSIPTRDQQTVAAAANVKLRLGRIIYDRQKGVDALIYRDLMTLARERAIATAYLVAGDEDVREGVAAAQDMGVRVVLVGIQTEGRNQSEFLIREADDHILLTREFLSPFLSLLVHPPQPTAQPVDASGTAMRIGAEFARAWGAEATKDEMQRLLGIRLIPEQLDIELLSSGEQVLGTLETKPELRERLREGFWKALGRVAALAPGSGQAEPRRE